MIKIQVEKYSKDNSFMVGESLDKKRAIWGHSEQYRPCDLKRNK